MTAPHSTRYAFCWICLTHMTWWFQADMYRCTGCGTRGLTAEYIHRTGLEL